MATIGVDTLVGLLLRWRSQTPQQRLTDWLVRFLLLFCYPIFLYCLTFYIHMLVQTKVGEGSGWMSPAYRRRLIGNTENPNLQPQGVLASIIEFQEKMFLNNRGIVTPHVWMSEWWSWPFDLKGVAYVTFNDRAVYFHGNPIVWWSVSLGLLWAISYFLYIPWRDATRQHLRESSASVYNQRLAAPGSVKFPVWIGDEEASLMGDAAFLLGGYLMNLLPFILIARVCFIYHYMPSLQQSPQSPP